jgi:superfamily II DNA/RNA helicase
MARSDPKKTLPPPKKKKKKKEEEQTSKEEEEEQQQTSKEEEEEEEEEEQTSKEEEEEEENGLSSAALSQRTPRPSKTLVSFGYIYWPKQMFKQRLTELRRAKRDHFCCSCSCSVRFVQCIPSPILVKIFSFLFQRNIDIFLSFVLSFFLSFFFSCSCNKYKANLAGTRNKQTQTEHKDGDRDRDREPESQRARGFKKSFTRIRCLG